ncbi:MAG: LytTR family DNA-binding domain-containing protein [Sphingomonadales bacterium]|jgi:hypothetical protein
MFGRADNPETQADQRADKRMFLVILGFVVLSWLILSTSDHMEDSAAGIEFYWLKPWVEQLTSHLAIIPAFLVIPWLLNRVPLSLEGWPRVLPHYALGFVAFGIIHVGLMDVLRSISYPLLLGKPNPETLLGPDLWVYELRKDIYTYLLVVLSFRAMRHIEQLQLEAQNIKEQARQSGRLELKSGGRHVFLDAGDILWAKAVSNYVEVHTAQGHHLIRMTLTALEGLLREAGDAHIRIHRSYLVKRDSIREVVPTGDGGAVVKTVDGLDLPASRKYRNSL